MQPQVLVWVTSDLAFDHVVDAARVLDFVGAGEFFDLA